MRKNRIVDERTIFIFILMHTNTRIEMVNEANRTIKTVSLFVHFIVRERKTKKKIKTFCSFGQTKNVTSEQTYVELVDLATRHMGE